jgi:DNA-binding CsgD family transcriptional regulator
MIEVYIKLKIVENWVKQIQDELGGFYYFKYHKTLDSLKNELNLVNTKRFVIIDISDNNYYLYTKEYFGNNLNIQFIAIGVDLSLLELEFLIKSNIRAFFQIGSTSMELLKAIRSNENSKFYLCSNTKDQLLTDIIDQINNSHLKSTNLLNTNQLVEDVNIIRNKNDELDINSLTEKEKKVTQLLIQGLSYKEIAQLMGVTSFAINQNTKRIYKKLSVRSRAELSFRLLN